MCPEFSNKTRKKRNRILFINSIEFSRFNCLSRILSCMHSRHTIYTYTQTRTHAYKINAHTRRQHSPYTNTGTEWNQFSCIGAIKWKKTRTHTKKTWQYKYIRIAFTKTTVKENDRTHMHLIKLTAEAETAAAARRSRSTAVEEHIT